MSSGTNTFKLAFLSVTLKRRLRHELVKLLVSPLLWQYTI